MHHRKSIRLKGYDYSQAGLYFITICTHQRECLFGTIEHDEMQLNDIGIVANTCWMDIPKHFPNAVLHAHIIMPNHVHGIIELTMDGDVGVVGDVGDVGIVGAENFLPLQSETPLPTHTPQSSVRAEDFLPQPPKRHEFQQMIPRSIGSIVKGFKIGVTKWCRNTLTEEFPSQRIVWQRNYYEHIIRNQQAYDTISEYILNNPKKWEEDKFHL